MTGFALSVAAAFLLVLLFQRRPVVWLFVGIATAVLLPTAAPRIWFAGTGNLARLHPSIWIFLFGFIITAVTRPSRPVGGIRRDVPVLMLCWLVAAGFLVTTHARASVGVAVFVYVLPVIGLFAVWIVAARRDADVWRKVAPLVLGLGVIEAALAIAQYLSHSSIVLGRYLVAYSWWRPNLSRANGTFDSPLDLAAFLTMVIPLTSLARRRAVGYVLVGFLSVGVVVTGSRTGVALAAVMIVWIILRRSRDVVPAVIASGVIALATFTMLSTPLASSLLDRFGSRGDLSTQVRSDALGTGLRLLAQGDLTGHGIGYAYTFSTFELRSSFENAYLATAIDLGLLLTVVLLALQLWFVLGNRSADLLRRLPGLLAVVWGLAYSSFVSTSTFGTLAWVIIGLSAVARDRPGDQPGDRSGQRPAAGAATRTGTAPHRRSLVGSSVGSR